MIDPANLAMLGGAVGLGGLFAHACFGAMADFEPDHGDVHGDARFATLQDALDAGLSTDWESGLFVGVWHEPVKNRLGFTTTRTHLLSTCAELSGLVIAPPGAGKFINAVGSTLLANSKDQLICYDPKGEGAAVSIASLRRRGYKPVLIDPMNELKGAYGPSASINPLGDLDIDSPQVEEDTATQVATLVPKTGAERNPFFVNTPRALLTSIGLFMLETRGRDASWPLVVDQLNASPFEFNKMFEAMRRSRFASVRYTGNEWHMPMDDKGRLQLRPEGLGNVLSTTKSETDFLSRGAMRRLFGASTFSFASLKRPGEKWAVFIVFPEAASKAMAKATELLISAAKNALLHAPRVPVLILIDELCTSLPESAAPMIQTLFSFGRGHGVRVVGVAQSWGQIVAWAGGENQAAAIRASAGAVIYYGSNDPITSAEIRKECGDRTIWAPSTNPLAGLGIDGASTQAMGVPLLRDSDLRNMLRYGTQIIMLSGSGVPVMMPRTPYFQIPILAARAAENPYYRKEGKP